MDDYPMWKELLPTAGRHKPRNARSMECAFKLLAKRPPLPSWFRRMDGDDEPVDDDEGEGGEEDEPMDDDEEEEGEDDEVEEGEDVTPSLWRHRSSPPSDRTRRRLLTLP